MRHRHLWLTHADGLDASVALRIHTLKLHGTSTPRMMQMAQWCSNLQTLHLMSRKEHLRLEDTTALLALRNPHLHSVAIQLHMVVMDRNALVPLVDDPGWLELIQPSRCLPSDVAPCHAFERLPWSFNPFHPWIPINCVVWHTSFPHASS